MFLNLKKTTISEDKKDDGKIDDTDLHRGRSLEGISTWHAEDLVRTVFVWERGILIVLWIQ